MAKKYSKKEVIALAIKLLYRENFDFDKKFYPDGMVAYIDEVKVEKWVEQNL